MFMLIVRCTLCSTKNEGMLADHIMFLFELFLKSFRLLNGLNLQICFGRDQFTKAQKRKSGAFRSAAVIMNELQRSIEGWEVII